jgi:hypothetical protein
MAIDKEYKLTPGTPRIRQASVFGRIAYTQPETLMDLKMTFL